MATQSANGRRWRRRQFIIDRRLQLGVAGEFLAGLGGVALLCGVALYIFLGGQAVPGLEPLRRFLLVANATYFILAAGILTLLTILITHRFAGPAYVMRLAIRGMLEGDYSRRLTLRSKDYLKPLASELDAIRHIWVRHDEESRRLLAKLEEALKKGDVAEAREITTRLTDGLLVSPGTEPATLPSLETEPEAAPAPEAEVEATHAAS